MIDSNCYYCGKDMKPEPQWYGVNKELHINNRKFWEQVGVTCTTCFEKGEPVSIMYRRKAA